MAGPLLERGAAAGRRRRRARKPMAEINVTPFVDVMLVLLIIFMVAAPLLTVGVPIELPETAATPLATEDEEPLTIALAADGRVSDVMQIMGALNAAGFRDIGLVTDPGGPRFEGSGLEAAPEAAQ